MQRVRSVPSRLVRFTALAAISVSLLISIAVAPVFHHKNPHGGLFSLANGVGPTAESLLHGNGLLLITKGMGTETALTYRAARMPVASIVIATGALLFGPNGVLTVRADVRKGRFFATIHKVGSADVSGSALMLAETGVWCCSAFCYSHPSWRAWRPC